MNLPPIPTVPQVALPPQFVLPLEALATFWAIANIVLGFMYLLYGLKVFRVMTTITAALWGAAIGVFFAHLIDSVTVALIFGAAALGTAAWFYTRWMIALPLGLAAAALGWQTAELNGANPLAAFFISIAAAVAVGGPVLIFYRTVVIGLTCLQGAALIVIGSATGILLLRHKPIALLQNDLHTGAHLLLGSVCVLLMALPAFYFQRLRYAGTDETGEGEASSAKEATPRRKAA
ncbi:MAG TPA: hypothetical protein VFE47_21495 [Tepidisphaeraceae bacterium]|jgi:hypothetical protein|nr:hypothetical protein [Tepidisphaeraceae bacterium]